MWSQIFIPTPQAAYIAGLTDRQLNRVVDEHLLPSGLVEQGQNERLFTRLGAAFATFYFATDDVLVAGTRRLVLQELVERLNRVPEKNEVLNLAQVQAVDWKVRCKAIEIDLRPYVQAAHLRSDEVDWAETLVTTDPQIMGSTPVFAGTRVPLEIVLGSLDSGIGMERLRGSYAFLTEAHIQAARVYQAVHPRKGRPRRLLAEQNPGLVRRVKRLAAA